MLLAAHGRDPVDFLDLIALGGLGLLGLVVSGAIFCVIVILRRRRIESRLAEQRTSESIEVPIVPEIVNRRVLAITVCTIAILVAMVVATGQGSRWESLRSWPRTFTIAMSLVFFAGALFSWWAATQRIGRARLERSTGVLRVEVGPTVRQFSLNEPFHYALFALPPSGVNAYGSAGVEVTQAAQTVRFHYPLVGKEASAKSLSNSAPTEFYRTDATGQLLAEEIVARAKPA